MTGIEAEALIAPSSAVVKSVLECNDSVGFYDVCRQIVPFTDHSVAEEILPDIQTRSLLLKLVQMASSVVVRIVNWKKLLKSIFSFLVNNVYVSIRSPLTLRFSNVVKFSLSKCSS